MLLQVNKFILIALDSFNHYFYLGYVSRVSLANVLYGDL